MINYLNKVTCGDCLDLLKELPDASIDAVITDPPYAEIKRDYGRLSESDWHTLMNAVVLECRRVLKPTGSAMFVIQPNKECIGRMRMWVWDFIAKWGREWGLVQDVYWWNYNAIPSSGCDRKYGLMRPSIKPCVWLGEADCYRNQNEVLWEEAEANIAYRNSSRFGRQSYLSGHSKDRYKIYQASVERGGVTPFNVLPITNSGTGDSAGEHGHGAGTPFKLCDWWVRYISPPESIVLDPFMGSGTVALACIKNNRQFIGFEKMLQYAELDNKRIVTGKP